MNKIQSILFDKQYWTFKRIAEYLVKHDLNPITKADIDDNYYKIKLQEQSKDKKYITKKIKNGLKHVIEI